MVKTKKNTVNFSKNQDRT